jgi:hypothetical protein
MYFEVCTNAVKISLRQESIAGQGCEHEHEHKHEHIVNININMKMKRTMNMNIQIILDINNIHEHHT